AQRRRAGRCREVDGQAPGGARRSGVRLRERRRGLRLPDEDRVHHVRHARGRHRPGRARRIPAPLIHEYARRRVVQGAQIMARAFPLLLMMMAAAPAWGHYEVPAVILPEMVTLDEALRLFRANGLDL